MAVMPASYYAERRISLLTKHGKERIIAPMLEVLGCQLEAVTQFDTDQLGTFTREIPRVDTQLDTARKKARIGMDIAGTLLGLASEGAFGSDPFVGLMPWNRELIILVDAFNGIEIVGFAQGPGNHHHYRTCNWDDAADFAKKIGFPVQYVILRPNNDGDPRIIKDVFTWEHFECAFRSASAMASDGYVFLETDGRAHGNPSRRNMIEKATEDLLTKMRSSCPSCEMPGYAVKQTFPGLPCAHCGRPTKIIHAELWLCQKCGNIEKRETSHDEKADPMFCDHCNP